MGNMDSIIRIFAAALIVVLYFTHVLTGTLGTIALIIAGILILTGLFKFCPMYLIFGLRTNTKNKRN
jgi:hypothetical protein